MKKYNVSEADLAIYCEKDLGPVFGLDLCIANKSNLSKSNSCDVDAVYSNKEEEKKNIYLAGEKFFTVEDIEIYAIC